MKKRKIVILLPDGIGLRNFAFSKFHEIGSEYFEIIFWNNTPFNLEDLNFSQLKITDSKPHIISDILKNVINQSTLRLNKKNEKDDVYDSYLFKTNPKGLKNIIKYTIVNFLVLICTNSLGLRLIKKGLYWLEQRTKYFKTCTSQLIDIQPDFVFCTNQRHLSAVAPLLAANKLNIPTATFIFSWDNLPKATMVVKTDYYFVWSDYMKKELLKYYPEINNKQIKITGTPQFEAHFDNVNFQSKEDFFHEYSLDVQKQYICYSGDDITTCPDDEVYLENVAKAVKELNSEGFNLGIIFRRSPVDFSDRYNEVLNKYKNCIVSINPKWTKKGEEWNTILPLKEDNSLLVNTILHTEMVINLGSSMVFDYAVFDKPCLYINYNVKNRKLPNWSVETIYKFVHFRSMTSKNDVVWLNNENEISEKIKFILQNKNKVNGAKNWFNLITKQPADKASIRTCEEIRNILNNV